MKEVLSNILIGEAATSIAAINEEAPPLGSEAETIGRPDQSDSSDIVSQGTLSEVHADAKLNGIEANVRSHSPVRLTDDQLLSVPPTERGTAELMAQLYDGGISYIYEEKTWAICNRKTKVWEKGKKEGVIDDLIIKIARDQAEAAERLKPLLISPLGLDPKEYAKKVAEEEEKIEGLKEAWPKWARKCESTAAIENIKRQLRNFKGIVRLASEFNANPDFVAFNDGNGVNLKTGRTRSTKPTDLVTLTLGCSTPPDLKANVSERRIIKAIREMLGDDDAVIHYFRKMGFYILSGRKKHKVWLVMHGATHTSKTTLLRLLLALMGGYGCTTMFKTFDESSSREKTEYALAAMQHARFVMIDESDLDKVIDAALVKTTTGGAEIVGRHPYGRPVRYVPQFLIAFATNYEPRPKNDDGAFWTRTRVIEMRQVFHPDRSEVGKPIPNTSLQIKPATIGLEEELTTNSHLQDLLVWFLQAREAFEKEGLADVPESMQMAVDAYRRDTDWLGHWIEQMLEDCAKGQGDFLGLLYRNIVSWLAAKGHKFTLTENGFYRLLRDKGFDTSQRRRTGSGDNKANFLPGKKLKNHDLEDLEALGIKEGQFS